MWVEQDGSKQWSQGNAGRVVYRRFFKADINSGLTEAASQGYAYGQVLVVNNSYMTLSGIDSHIQMGHDFVTLTWSTPTGPGSRNTPHSEYNDGVPRADGDEEWWVEFETSEVAAVGAVSYKNEVYNGAWGVAEDAPLEQPGAILVWAKWLDKNDQPNSKAPKTLPRKQAEALAMLATYLPGSTGSYEKNGPKLMYVLGSTGVAANLLCVDIEISRDGNLVVRTARFKYKRDGWNRYAYGGL